LRCFFWRCYTLFSGMPLYLNERRTLLSNCDDININIETLLFGNDKHSYDVNSKIFGKVRTFINQSKDFRANIYSSESVGWNLLKFWYLLQWIYIVKHTAKKIRKLNEHIYVLVIFVFSVLRWEVIVHFIDIGGIVDHHCF
jgi:hypothetical protein